VSESLELRLQPDRRRYTLPHFLADVTSRHGDRCAIRFLDRELGVDRELSYRELEREARRLARALVAAGVVKGARVAVLMANRPEWVVAAFGVSLAGGVLIPVNTFAKPAERDYILRHSDASLLLVQRSLLKHDFLADLQRDHVELASAAPGRLLCPALPQLRRVVALGLEAREGAVQGWQELLAQGDSVPDSMLDAIAQEITPADDGLVIYTSGTTAHPKGVLHLQRAPVIQSWRFAEGMELSPEDVVYTAQPFFWSAGIAMSLGAALAAGACLLLEASFEPGAALACIEANRATAIFAWPHQDKAMAEHPSAQSRDLSCARKVEFDSPLAARVGLEKDEWGTHGSYGMSETFTIASFLPVGAPAELRNATSGRPLPGMQMRVVDPESGAALPQGEKGEIAVRGVTFMRGYYKVEPELYLDDEGYFRTQDGGSFDAEGYLHWSGRLSNLIKTGGANVSPVEIETALRSYPGLKAGLAVGVPHPALGEVVVLCAVPVPGAEPDEAAIRGFLRERLAAYKVPKRVLVFAEEELQYTGTQKIQVGPLREAALARLEREGAEVEGFRYRRGA